MLKIWYVTLFAAATSAIEVDDVVFKQLVDGVTTLEDKVMMQDTQILEQKKEIARLEFELKELKDLAKISKRQALAEGPVGFSAAVKSPLAHLQQGDGVVFETVITNIGDCYHNDSGIFDVPLHGIYIFSCSILDKVASTSFGKAKAHAEIVQNNATLARAFAHAEDTYNDQGAQTVIVEANAGDKIWIRIIHTDDLGLGGNLYTTFSGYMLWQL